MTIYFYSTREKYGCFSNFSRHGFELDSVWWMTSEHYLRSDWESIKDDIMLQAVLSKFETHTDICDILLATGNELIAEKTTTDYYLGCGKDGSGKNRLGEILMEVRQILRDRTPGE